MIPDVAARHGFTQAMWNGMALAEKASIVNRLFDLEAQAVRAQYRSGGRSLGNDPGPVIGALANADSKTVALGLGAAALAAWVILS